MRVITGEYRGRKLETPENYDVRPTSDKVKEAVFNLLMNDTYDAVFCDLFAGTGSLGIEALSRGAGRCVFVDSSRQAAAVIRDNVALTGFSDRAQVVQGDAISFLGSCREKFGLAFLDPPYAADLLEKALFRIAEIDIMAENGIIVCESAAEKALPTLPAPYEKGREYRYGKIKLTLYHRRA